MDAIILGILGNALYDLIEGIGRGRSPRLSEMLSELQWERLQGSLSLQTQIETYQEQPSSSRLREIGSSLEQALQAQPEFRNHVRELVFEHEFRELVSDPEFRDKVLQPLPGMEAVSISQLLENMEQSLKELAISSSEPSTSAVRFPVNFVSARILASIALAFSLFMIAFPVLIILIYLAEGRIVISPPLLSLLFAGLIGLKIGKALSRKKLNAE